MSDVRKLSFEEFDELLASEPAVLVDFYADWCMPCKMMAPVVDKIAATFDGRLAVAKVNVDEAPELAIRYNIQSIPALVAFKGGEAAQSFIGVRPFEDLETALNTLL